MDNKLFSDKIERDFANEYPRSEDYEYTTEIETLNLDEECEKDIIIGEGFITDPYISIKKELKSENGIFSPKFGQTLGDVNRYINRYKCRCGAIQYRGRINHGIKCKICGTRVECVEDDFNFFGYIPINEPYAIIHPAYYKKLESFFGKGADIDGEKRTKIENIIDAAGKSDKDGHDILIEDKPKDEPYYRIGIIEFMEKFDEIIEYYYNLKKSSKQAYYDDILENRDKIFIHHIPVFTTLLRPMDIKDNNMSFEESNSMYSIMSRLATIINKNKTKMQQNPKVKNKNLYKLQKMYMKLYKELEDILSGKKGDIRCLLGGRYNFSARNVIVQNPDLRIDQVTLPYVTLVIILEQRIKNILHRLYNISFADAHNIWYDALITPSNQIKGIIKSIINNYKSQGLSGIPVIINRNPTIGYGSILQMFCIDFTETYTMAVPVQPLPLFNGDFDGDVLNIMLILNRTFFQRSFEIFNPRNAMYVSRNDGYFNLDVSMQRDTLINANTLVYMGRYSYTPKEKAAIDIIYNRNKINTL